MVPNRREAFVCGVGMTAFGRHAQASLAQLGMQAGNATLLDAGLVAADVQAAYCGCALGGIMQGETGVGQSVLGEMGLYGIPVTNVENACVSGANALQAQQHMRRYGTTAQQMAMVSVKNHQNGTLNPLAQFNKPLTLEQVLSSPMIAEPLTLYSCCPNSDGAAAALVCSERFLRQPNRANRAKAARCRTASRPGLKGELRSIRVAVCWRAVIRRQRPVWRRSLNWSRR